MLRISRERDDVVVETGHLMLALRKQGGSYTQYMHSRRGGAPPLLRSEPGLVGEKGRIIPSFDTLKVVDDRQAVRLELQGASGVHRFGCTITVREAEKWIHIVVKDRLAQPVQLEGIASTYRVVRTNPDFVFAPYIRPFDDTVIGQSAFKSPVIAWLAGGTLLLLVADTDQLNAVKPPIPAYLDFDAELDEPRMGYGLITHAFSEILYFRHRAGETVQFGPGELSYGYYLVVEEEVQPEDAAGVVSRFLWQSLATSYSASTLPQLVPLETYARRGLDYAIPTLWQEFDLQGKPCGGIRSGLRFPNDIWFQYQHNNLDSALALHYFGELWNDAELRRKAECVKNLILTSPQDRGLFSTVFTANIRFGVLRPQWISSSHWVSPDLAAAYGMMSRQSLSRLIDWDMVYHTVSCSTAAHTMLVWYQEVEADPHLVERCRAYGDYLLAIQQQSGAIPSWIYRDSFEVEALLKDNVNSACSGMFLAELYRVTRDPKYLTAAQRVAAFILERIRPIRQWQDYETFFDSLAKPFDLYDHHTNQYPQTTGGIYWTSELLRILFETTGEKSWLIEGARVTDYLSLFQAVWSPHFLSMYCFGGFAVGNGHPAWNDARQQLFGRLFLRYYNLTHDAMYFSRGLAAIRANLPLIFMPENQRVSPCYKDGPQGWCMENYSHRGQDKCVTVTGSYDFSLGNCLTSLGFLLREYGTLAVNLDNDQVLGVDGVVVRSCRVEGSRIDLVVEDKVGEARKPVVTILSTQDKVVEVILNGMPYGTGMIRDGKLRLGGPESDAHH